MAEPLHLPAKPCSTCPYRCDTPPGIWHPSEYEKLPAFDEDAPEPNLGLFLCHHSTTQDRNSVCRGWLSVARESVAARLAVMTGAVPDEARYEDLGVEMYPDGQTAAEAGMAGVENPDADARRVIAKLVAARKRRTRIVR